MADYEATGEGLEKLVRMGRKRPMPFAYCPPKGDEDGLFATHRKKAPELIAKAARKAAATTKVCYGTFTVEAKVMNVVLIKELPNIAKKLKKHLRRERLSLNVRILDAFGNELESDFDDVGDLAEIFDEGGDDDFDDDDDDDDGDDDDDEDSSTGGEDLAVTPQAAVPQDPIDIDDPEDDSDLTEDDGSQKVAADPVALAKRLRALHPSVAGLPPDIGARLTQALSGAARLIRAGAVLRAEETIEAIEGAFARQTKLVEQAKLTPSPEPAIEIALAKQLVSLRTQAESLGQPARDKVIAALGLAAQQVKVGETGRAAQNIHMIQTALAQSSTPTNPLPVDKGAIEASRTNWATTRTEVDAEIGKLKAAMDKTLASIDGLAPALSETSKLFEYLKSLDSGLDDTLAALMHAKDHQAGERLLSKARQIVAQYRQELDAPFFHDVDGDNGFVTVNVRAPALKSLSEIDAVLA